MEAVLIRLLAVIAHIIVSYVAIFTFGFGIAGAGVALIITELISTAAIGFVVKHLQLLDDITDNLNYEAFKGTV